MMKRKIKVSLPVNMSLDKCHKELLSYKIPPPKVLYVKGGFITSTGLVCGRNGLIKECCHYEWESQPPECLAQARQFYRNAQQDSQKLLVFDDDETYVLIHHPWYANYYHWLNESIYRLWIIKDKIQRMILLLPAQDNLSKFTLDSLTPFNFKSIIHIPDGKSVIVRTLCLPAQKPVVESFNPKALLEIKKTYVEYVSGTKTNINTNDRIYISRKKSMRRKLINEDDVIKTLLKYNFTILCSEDYSFFEQVSIFSGAKYLVGSHGAGLTNMLFMPRGSAVLELIKRKTNAGRHNDLLFWYMADALGHRYYNQICEPINKDELFFSADTIVDINMLNRNLELIFKN